MVQGLNLVVIRATNIAKAAVFYTALGLKLDRHSHGTGPAHYVADINGLTFEIYPMGDQPTSATRLGFKVDQIEETIAALVEKGGILRVPLQTSPWGRRAVLSDPDGHKIELTEA